MAESSYNLAAPATVKQEPCVNGIIEDTNNFNSSGIADSSTSIIKSINGPHLSVAKEETPTKWVVQNGMCITNGSEGDNCKNAVKSICAFSTSPSTDVFQKNLNIIETNAKDLNNLDCNDNNSDDNDTTEEESEDIILFGSDDEQGSESEVCLKIESVGSCSETDFSNGHLSKNLVSVQSFGNMTNDIEETNDKSSSSHYRDLNNIAKCNGIQNPSCSDEIVIGTVYNGDDSVGVLPLTNDDDDVQSNELNINIVNNINNSSYSSDDDIEKNMLKCDLCEKICLNSEDYVQHMKSHNFTNSTTANLFKCDKCDKGYASCLDLKRHDKSHFGQKTFDCYSCGKCYIKSKGLIQHMQIHEGKYTRKCLYCNKTFIRNGDYLRHIVTHTGEKPFQCTECLKAFTRNTSLIHHLRVVHNIQRSVQGKINCENCGKNCTSAAGLSLHIKTCSKSEEKATKQMLMFHQRPPYPYVFANMPVMNGQCFGQAVMTSAAYGQVPSLASPSAVSSVPHSTGVRPMNLSVRSNVKKTVPLKLGVFKCDTCGKICGSKSEMERHERTHSGEKPYICRVCGKRYALGSNLKIHFRSHNDEDPFSCNICGSIFSKASSYDQHRKICKEMGEEKCCFECGDSFSDDLELKIHVESHKIKFSKQCDKDDRYLMLNKDERYKCENCENTFPTEILFHKHEKLCKEKSSSTFCNLCGLFFDGNPSIEEHMKTHETEKSHVIIDKVTNCKECGEKFNSNEELNNHMKLQECAYNFVCEVCKKCFPSKVDLENHVRIHAEVKRYPCRECGKQFTISTNLKKHFRIYHSESNCKPFYCTKCGCDFDRAAYYDLHDKSCTGKSALKFCIVCGEFFDNNERLEHHMKTHSEEKMLDCEKCGEQFDSPNDLFDHLKTHLNSVTFECEVCNENFENAFVLSEHLKMHSIATQIKTEIIDSDGNPPSASTIINVLSKNHLLKCVLCDTWCSDSTELSNHTLNHHSEEKQIKLEKIDTYFEINQPVNNADNGMEFLDNDLHNSGVPNGDFVIKDKRCTRSSTKACRCQICDKDFDNGNELSVHLTTHVRKKKLKVECEKIENLYCNNNDDPQTSPSKRKIARNEKSSTISKDNKVTKCEDAENNDKSFECRQCEKVFTSQNRFVNHIKSHFFKKPTEQGTDKVSENTSSKLAEHLISHSVKKTYQCDDCDKCFFLYQELKVHEFHHKGKKPYSCKECGKCFVKSSALFYHKKIHTGEEPYKCNYCDKSFRSSSNLKAHENLHTGLKNYKCNECGKVFRSKSNLMTHQKFHGEDKPHKCYVCGKGFAVTYNLKVHIRTHTGEKLYNCEWCDAAYNNKDSMKKHCQSVHNNIYKNKK